MPVPLPALLAAMAVVAVAALFQGIVGVGFNVVGVPLLLLIDPVLAPVPNLLLAVPLVVSQLIREHESIDRSGVAWILLGRIPGGLLGLWLLLSLDDRMLNITLAALILAVVVLLLGGRSIPLNPGTGMAAGTFSGVAGIVGAIGGPPVGLLYKDAAPPVVRSTLGVIFSVGLVISIGLRAVGGKIVATDFQAALWLLPAMIAGFALSSRVRHRFDGPWVRRGILAVSAAAAVTLLVRSLTG